MAETAEFLRPVTLADALTARAAGPCTLLAGGTDFFPTLGARAPKGRVMDMSAVGGLGDIDLGPESVRIGANVTWADLCHAALPQGFDGLKAAGLEIGAIQIQNRATLVGNICNASPAADGVPALLTLDAAVELASKRKTRLVPLDAFITGVRRIDLAPDEIVTALVIPKSSGDGTSVFRKLGSRHSLVISIVSVAVWMKTSKTAVIEDLRIAVGSCSAVACRLPALEAALTGRSADPETIRSIVTGGDFSPLAPIDDVRGSKEFRENAAREMGARAVIDAGKSEGGNV